MYSQFTWDTAQNNAYVHTGAGFWGPRPDSVAGCPICYLRFSLLFWKVMDGRSIHLIKLPQDSAGTIQAKHLAQFLAHTSTTINALIIATNDAGVNH